MITEKMVQGAGTAAEAKLDNRALLARHLAQQPQSRRSFDKLMKALEVAGLALIAGHMAWAVYISANWTVANRIAAVWLAVPASIAALLVLVGLHAAGSRAFFPVALPGGPQELVTGSNAVGMGTGFAIVLLIVGAFWAAFAWGIWTTNWAILKPLTHIIVVVVGVGAAVAVASDLYKKLLRSR
jgi:RsiW-degrading membrane proteinase PrsW (M82 family)